MDLGAAKAALIVPGQTPEGETATRVRTRILEQGGVGHRMATDGER